MPDDPSIEWERDQRTYFSAPLRRISRRQMVQTYARYNLAAMNAQSEEVEELEIDENDVEKRSAERFLKLAD